MHDAVAPCSHNSQGLENSPIHDKQTPDGEDKKDRSSLYGVVQLYITTKGQA
jgi:hypothetical protein